MERGRHGTCIRIVCPLLRYRADRALLGIVKQATSGIDQDDRGVVPEERAALATGFDSGANIGAVVAPATVPWLAEHWGWGGAFIATGAIGFFWIIAWLLLYERPEISKRVSKEELAFIQSDREEATKEKVPMGVLFRHKETWAFVIGKFLDPHLVVTTGCRSSCTRSMD